MQSSQNVDPPCSSSSVFYEPVCTVSPISYNTTFLPASSQEATCSLNETNLLIGSHQQQDYIDLTNYGVSDPSLSDLTERADSLFLTSPQALTDGSNNASPQPYPILSSPQDIYHEIVCECAQIEKNNPSFITVLILIFELFFRITIHYMIVFLNPII